MDYPNNNNNKVSDARGTQTAWIKWHLR